MMDEVTVSIAIGDHTYDASVDADGVVTIGRDGHFATRGKVRFNGDGSVSIDDADAPLGDAVYAALEEALAEEAYLQRQARERDEDAYGQAERSHRANGDRRRQRRNPAVMTEETARTVIGQLGGMGRLRTMVGAYDLLRGYDENGWPAFSFRFKGSKSFNFVRITLTPLDVYAVRIGKVSGYKLINVKDFTDIYAEQLRRLFERTTGLYLSM